MTFQNPYENVPDEGVSRINSDVPTDEYKMVQRILTERGTIQTTVNLLWNKLINELKRRGITDYTHAEEFRNFVTNSNLVLETPSGRGGSPSVRLDTKANERTVNRGTPRPSVAATTTANRPSDVPRRRGGR